MGDTAPGAARRGGAVQWGAGHGEHRCSPGRPPPGDYGPAAPPGPGAVQKASGRGNSRRDSESAVGQPAYRRRRGQRPGEAGCFEAAERKVRYHRGRFHVRRAGGCAGAERL